MPMLAFILIVTALAAGAATQPADRPAAPPLSPETRQLLTRFFLADSDTARRDLLQRVAAQPDATPRAVADALHDLPLWFPAPPGEFNTPIDCGDGKEFPVLIRIPHAYDPARPWPLIIALHGTDQPHESMMRWTCDLLGDRAEQFLIACPRASVPGPFAGHELTETLQPVAVLRRLRRLYHLDSDRVYLTGYSKGGHRTCAAAVHFADQFAAVIPVAGCMGLPQREGLYPQFLPNLRHLPMLLCWGELDASGSDGKESSLGGITGINRRFMDAARPLMLPVTPFEQPGAGHGNVRPPDDLLAAFLNRKRTRNPPQVSHWFRFPQQGRAYWLRLIEFSGEPWTGRELHVQLQPGENAEEAILRQTRRQIARLTGEIDGQIVTVRAARARALDVLLNDDLLDLGRPVTIKLNGRRTFEGLLAPDTATLLDVADDDWDFDRLFTVRVRLEPARPGRPY